MDKKNNKRRKCEFLICGWTVPLSGVCVFLVKLHNDNILQYIIQSIWDHRSFHFTKIVVKGEFWGHTPAAASCTLLSDGFLPAELSLSLFCLPLRRWHVGESEGEGGEEGGRECRGLAQRPCAVLAHNKHDSDWERKRVHGRSPFPPACPPRSVSASLRALSIQHPRCSSMSMSGSQTPEDGLYGEWWWYMDQAIPVISLHFFLNFFFLPL